MPKFNVLIVGNRGTHKTSFINRIINNRIDDRIDELYFPTKHIKRYNYCQKYKKNTIDIDFFDTSEEQIYTSGFPKQKPDAVLIFGLNMIDYHNIDYGGWYRNVKKNFNCDIPRINVLTHSEDIDYNKSRKKYSTSILNINSFINVKTMEGIVDLLEKLCYTLLLNKVEKIPEKSNNTLIDEVNMKIQDYFNKYQDEIKSLRKELQRKDSEIEILKLELNEFNGIKKKIFNLVS